MCQSSGCRAMVSAKKSATSCIMATKPARPGRGMTRSPMMITMPRSVNWQTAGSRVAPVRRARIAGPAGMVIGKPRQATGTPVPVRSRSARQTDHPAALDCLDQRGEYTRVAMREHLQTETFAEGDEVCKFAIRQLLSDRGHGHSGDARPSTCEIPVPAVRQRDNSSGPRVSIPNGRLVDRCDTKPNLGFRPVRQSEHFIEGAEVGGQGGAQQVLSDRRTSGLHQVADAACERAGRSAATPPS